MTSSNDNKVARFINNFVGLFTDTARLILLTFSFLVVLASIVIRPITIIGWDTASYLLSYVFPFVIYFIFLSMAAMAKGELQSEVRNEEEITRIIDKYEGIVDGIGTALPLIGAGLILYFISQIAPGHKSSTLPDPNQQRFLNIGAPFEVKSIFLLAAAKLFEPIFDSLAREGQRKVSVEGSGGVSEKVPETILEILNNNDLENKLNKINETAAELKTTFQSLESDKVMYSLDQLVELSKKLK